MGSNVDANGCFTVASNNFDVKVTSETCPDKNNGQIEITANETIEGTVVFIDICGFTTISEKSSPDEVVKLLNNYFDVKYAIFT